MQIFTFAHNGVHHTTGTEAVAHEASDSTLWIIAGSVAMALVFYSLSRFLSRRQTQEETSQEDQEF
jgi:hypothetical protein